MSRSKRNGEGAALKGIPRKVEPGGIVIVGAGLAGLFTALKLAPLPVTRVQPFTSKPTYSQSQPPRADTLKSSR